MLKQDFREKHAWMVFLLPFGVYMLIGSLEPAPGQTAASLFPPAVPYAWYPLVYTLKIAATLVALGLVGAGFRQFPPRLSAWAIVVGVVGAAVWIALAKWGLHVQAALADVPLLKKVLGFGARPAYNPFAQLAGSPAAAWGFFAVRLTGLALVVPLIEESFLRGFVMRLAVKHEWWEVPFGTLTRLAAVASVAVPALYHPPAELAAVIVWFSLVTWLMAKTRNFWDCVAAHAVTNLLLGIYVVAWGDWPLW